MKLRVDMIGFGREALGLSESLSIELSPLEGRGSDRTFFRLRWNQKDSAILIHYDQKRVENTFYADIAKFLREINVPVPQIIRHDPFRTEGSGAFRFCPHKTFSPRRERVRPDFLQVDMESKGFGHPDPLQSEACRKHILR